MADAPIPIELFEPAMPAAMRPLIEEAKKRRGGLAWLLTEEGRNGSAVQQMLRLSLLPPEITGWAAGISMFFRDPGYVLDIMAMHDVTAPMPFLIEALGAGLAAGVECPLATWKCIDRLAQRHDMPDSMVGALTVGFVSNSSIIRKAALGVALKKPHLARQVLAVARLKKWSATQAKRLDDALAALGGGPAPIAREKDGLLDRLLEAWARTFDERLIAPIVAAGSMESAKRGPLTSASKGELERTWTAIAKQRDPGDVARLLATQWPGAWPLALTRLQALDQFPPDPRIATAVKENVARYTSIGARAVQEAAERLVFKMHQLEVRDAPEELLREAAKLTPHKADLEALWRSFWEDPTDEGRRAVLADALQSAGDPRGEFIALQLAIESGAADASAEKRADELLEQHIDSWSGGLPGVRPRSREFRRGFLAAARLEIEREHLPKSLDRKEWRTIECLRVEVGRASARDVGPLLERMPCLRVLLFDHLNDYSVQQWSEGVFPAVKVLGTSTSLLPKRPDQFPSLEILCVAADPLKALELARFSGLKGVMVLWHPLETALRAFESLLVHGVAELRSAPGMRGDYEPQGWTVRVTRAEPERAQLFHSGRYEKGSFEQVVKDLAAHGRTSLQIHCASSLKKRLEEEPCGSASLTFRHQPFDVFLPPPLVLTP